MTCEVRDEISIVIGEDKTQTPTAKTPHAMGRPYLGDLLGETMRLLPTIPPNGHLCVNDTTLPTENESDRQSLLPILGNVVT
jgi:hypothetical protein